VIPRFKEKPRGLQLLLESMVGYFDTSAKEELHRHGNFVGPYVFVAAVFIALSTVIELVGLRPAFTSINAGFAFGFMTLFVINICRFREKKALGGLKSFINPINLITTVTVPLSLSLRLFGAIISGYIIMEMLYSMIYTAVGIPVFVSLVTTFFHAFLQAYLFAVLTIMFTSEAVE
jgi:F-type H+-transporting ATPase subunit a